MNHRDPHAATRKVAARMCSGCPFAPDRDWRAVPYSAEDWRHALTRIVGGERWICHASCDGDWVTERSLYCRGAFEGRPVVIPAGEQMPFEPGELLDVAG
jgi:hypothetical protein